MIPKYDEFKRLVNESFNKSVDEKRLSSIDMTKQTPLFRLLARQYAIYLEDKIPHKSILLPFNIPLSEKDVDMKIEEEPSYDSGDYWTPPSSEAGYVSFSVPDFELRLEKTKTDDIINGADIYNISARDLCDVVNEVYEVADTTNKNNATTYYISFKNAYFGGSCSDDVESHFELVDTNIVDMNEKDALDLLTHIFEYALIDTFREFDVCAFDIDTIWDNYEEPEPEFDKDEYLYKTRKLEDED